MMKHRLSSREQKLSVIVGGIVFLFVNYLLIEWGWTTHTRLQAAIAGQKKQLRLISSATGDLASWEKRDAWLQAQQPRLENADTAAVQLLDQIKVVAKNHAVLLENPAIRVSERQPEYVSVSVEIETKSPWTPLIKFLHELQSSGQFVAVESANLKVDASDATQMRGRFRIARWYAPR